VDDDEIERLLAEPKYIYEFLYGKQAAVRPGFITRLIGRKVDESEESKAPEWVKEAERVEADLDKAWHGIHYLLTGTDWEGEEPWCYLVKGGEEIGDIDVGYGPARGVRQEQVRQFLEALDGINPENLRKRFDAEKMMELDIYPTIWDRDPQEDDTLGYLIEYFHILRSFVHRAVEREKGLIIYLC